MSASLAEWGVSFLAGCAAVVWLVPATFCGAALLAVGACGTGSLVVTASDLASAGLLSAADFCSAAAFLASASRARRRRSRGSLAARPDGRAGCSAFFAGAAGASGFAVAVGAGDCAAGFAGTSAF